MENLIVETKDIVHEFANAVLQKDTELIESLLTDTGTFQIQDRKLKTQFVNKEQYMTWFKQRIDTVSVTQIDFDVCASCIFGARVVSFNNGKFPYIRKSPQEFPQTGLALFIEDGKIFSISFCFGFLNSEPKLKALNRYNEDEDETDYSGGPYYPTSSNQPNFPSPPPNDSQSKYGYNEDKDGNELPF